MSDNRRRYREVRTALKQLYPTEPKGNLARHLNTLAGLISGIIGSESTHLLKVGRTMRFTRWVKNERIEFETYFMPSTGMPNATGLRPSSLTPRVAGST